MKRLFRIVAALVLLLLLVLAIWVAFSPVAPHGTASVVFLSLTNQGAGQHGALLCFTNGSSVRVVGMVHSVDYKTAEGWYTNQPPPGAVAADIASSADLGPHEERVVLVRCPTNTAWRLRMRYHEQPRGPRGLFVRVTDLLSGLRDRARHVSYTGETYLAETPEIGSETNRPPAVLMVDDAHYVSSHENSHPERYYIAPSLGIILDATGYAFRGTPPAPEGKAVDWIDLLRHKTGNAQPAGEGGRYRLAWTPGKTQYELSPATLQSLAGSAPFEGFKAGERWFIFIGPAYRTNSLLALWSGVIEVHL